MTMMQLKILFIYAPKSLLNIRQNSLKWLSIYLFSALFVFGIVIWLLLDNQDTIKAQLLNYFFPQSWQWFSEILADFFFESQTKSVLVNLMLSGSLVLSSIFLFPIKEKFSSAFEQEAKLVQGDIEEHPLYMQALEEIRLLILYITAQSIILWIGYYPFLWSTILSTMLSYLFLFFSFSIDFISPTLQRHRFKYPDILRLIKKNGMTALIFGVLFNLPIILVSRWIISFQDISFIEVASILFILNIVFLTFAIPMGTFIASKLSHQIIITRDYSKKRLFIGYSSLLSLFFFGLLLHSQLIMSLHHKSQLLKANYALDWSSIQFNNTSISDVLNGKTLSQFSVDIVIENPTEYDIEIEDSNIIVKQNAIEISNIKIRGFDLPSGGNKRVTLLVDAKSSFDKISDFSDILNGWEVNVYLQVWPGMPFIINLIED